jgi:hypothetical protein
MTLKRIMVVPPSERVPGLLATTRGFFVGQEHGALRSLQLVHRRLCAATSVPMHMLRLCDMAQYAQRA